MYSFLRTEKGRKGLLLRRRRKIRGTETLSGYLNFGKKRREKEEESLNPISRTERKGKRRRGRSGASSLLSLVSVSPSSFLVKGGCSSSNFTLTVLPYSCFYLHESYLDPSNFPPSDEVTASVMHDFSCLPQRQKVHFSP